MRTWFVGCLLAATATAASTAAAQGPGRHAARAVQSIVICDTAYDVGDERGMSAALARCGISGVRIVQQGRGTITISFDPALMPLIGVRGGPPPPPQPRRQY